MKRKERNSIIKWACTLTDEELEKQFARNELVLVRDAVADVEESEV